MCMYVCVCVYVSVCECVRVCDLTLSSMGYMIGSCEYSLNLIMMEGESWWLGFNITVPG